MCIQREPFGIMTGLNFSSARELVQDPYACFRLVNTRRHLSLLPKYIGDLSRGIREQLDAELNLFSTSLNGVMIAYSKVRRFQQFGTILGSQPYLHLDIQADFIVFQPTQGSILKAVVNKIGRDYIGCLVHGCFNASVPKRSRDGGFLMASDVTIGQTFLFQVVKYFANNGVMSIRGSFFEDSFVSLPTSEDTGVKRKADELDGTLGGDDSVDLPAVIHKRRRTNSAGASVATAGENDELLTQETQNFSLPNGSQEEAEEGHKKKKKKKKKKRHQEESAEDGVNVEPTDHVPKINQPDIGDLANTFTTPETSDKGKHKKKKKDKRNYNEESLGIDNSGGSSSVTVKIEDTHPIENGTKKKKKKKHKHKHEESL